MSLIRRKSLFHQNIVSNSICFRYCWSQPKVQTTRVEYCPTLQVGRPSWVPRTLQIKSLPSLRLSNRSHSAKNQFPRQELSAHLPASASSISTPPPSLHRYHTGHPFCFSNNHFRALTHFYSLFLERLYLSPSNSWLLWVSSPVSPLQRNLC